jgi:hypothetical protein
MVLFSCLSGDFARAASCQAKAILLTPDGPVASIGATTESRPVPNY